MSNNTPGRFTVSAGIDRDGPFVAVTDNLAVQVQRYDLDTAMEVSQMMAQAGWRVMAAMLEQVTSKPALVVTPDGRPVRSNGGVPPPGPSSLLIRTSNPLPPPKDVSEQ